MTIASASTAAVSDKLVASSAASNVYVEKLSGSMQNLSAYVHRWSDVRGRSDNFSGSVYKSPVKESRVEVEAWPKYVSYDSVNNKLFFQVSEKIKNLYAADAAATFDPSQSRVAIRAAVDAVEEAIEAGDLIALDELLAGVDAQCLRKITSVALLRTSFRVRNKISKWNKFYSEVYAHLSRTGQDAHHALRGMVKG